MPTAPTVKEVTDIMREFKVSGRSTVTKDNIYEKTYHAVMVLARRGVIKPFHESKKKFIEDYNTSKCKKFKNIKDFDKNQRKIIEGATKKEPWVVQDTLLAILSILKEN